jgi:hypothetical protein
VRDVERNFVRDCCSCVAADGALPWGVRLRTLGARGDRLSLEQVKDAYRDSWQAEAEAEAQQLGIAWENDLREDRAFKLGLDAIELTFKQLVPRLGEPVAVQRRVEYTLGPGLEWSVLRFLDLETVRRDAAGNELPIVVTRSRARPRPSRRPTTTSSRRCTSPDAGSSATLPRSSRSPRSRSRPAPPGDGGVTGEHHPVGRAAARRARPDRVGRPADRGLLGAVWSRGAVGVLRPRRLEVQRALLRGMAQLSRRSGAVDAAPPAVAAQ